TAVPTQCLDEGQVERFGLIPWCCLREVRSSSLLACATRDQRELADDECLAAGVEQASVELAGLVLEDPQPRHLPHEALGLGGRVRTPDPRPHAAAPGGRGGPPARTNAPGSRRPRGPDAHAPA